MPYDNLPESDWAKMDKCVADVQAQGKSKDAAIAICYTSIAQEKSSNPIQLLWQGIRDLFAPHLAQEADPKQYYDPKQLGDELTRAVVDVASWDGAASNYPDAESYAKACLINLNTGDVSTWTKDLCRLPVREPGKSAYVRQAIHAAAAALAGGRGGLVKPDGVSDADWQAAITKAANELITAYEQAQEVAPNSIYELAGKPVPTKRTSQMVVRQANGKLRWFGVAATAVLNHDGMIDSRALFDSFIAHIERTKEYPQYDVLHFGEHCIVGQADYVFRDGAVYYATGTFNDDEFSQAVARGLEQDPGYWGHSIMFLSGQPDKLNIYDMDIPVFREGINKFISIVPRSRAASMFTDVTVQERGKTMMTDQQYNEMVKLVGKDLADKKRDELTQLNRTIDEAGLISREKKTEQSKAEEPKPEAKPVTLVAEIRTEEPKPAEDKTVTTEPEKRAVDDATVQALTAKVEELLTKLNSMMGAVGDVQSEQKQLAERLALVEKPVEERIAVALADAPEPKSSTITRAREVRSGDGRIDTSDTLEKLKAQREHRK